MYSALRVDKYVFDTWTFQTAYGEIQVGSTSPEAEYSEQALRTLVELFCDWGPSRPDVTNASAAASLGSLNDAEKRDLYQRFCAQLANNLEQQYNHEASEADVRQFLETLTTDQSRDELADFLLNYLWNYSQHLHDYDTETKNEDAQNFLNAIRNLPEEYRDTKAQQYQGSQKVNQIRYQILDALHDDGEIPVDSLQSIKTEENAKFGKNILQNWRDFTILGQLYFDYFKPRIDIYLNRLTTYLATKLEVTEFATHTVHFTEPQNYLTDFAWSAIYPGEDGNQKDEYQLYLGIHWNRITYGLHVGGNLRGEDWKSHRDLDQIQDTDRVSVSAVLQKLQSVKSDFLTLNGEQETSVPDKPAGADEIQRQLESEKQVVFYGPPGTGKTYDAKRFAEWWVHTQTETEPVDDQIQTVTFHPSFAYEDFIEGLTAEARDGNVAYEIENGVFKRLAESAKEAYNQAKKDGTTPPPYVFIVDEINRGNLAQIFGETITQLEADKRLDADAETVVQLAHSDDPFVIPPNLYLIGTMNTADRSIALVDAALRRRFRFLSFPPAFNEVVKEYDLPSESLNLDNEFEQLLTLSIAALEEMNQRIVKSNDLGKGKQIGHTRLFGLDEVQNICDTWRYDILPLLEEYYFGQFERIRQEQFDGNGDGLFNWEQKQIRDFDSEDLARELSDLVGEDVTLPASTDGGGVSSSSASRTYWDEELFFEELNSEFQPELVEVYETLYEFAETDADKIDWGTGKNVGAMQAYWDEYSDSERLVFESLTDGNVQFRFWSADDDARPAFERFAENIAPLVDDPPTADYLLSDDFTKLQVSAERLMDSESMEQFKTTVREFVEDYADALE